MVSSGRVWWRQVEAARAFGMARQIVVVTDIQDSSSETGAHSLRDESAGLAFLMSHGIPLVIRSRRTRAEIERLRRTLGLMTPFISEHGSALFLPRGCFPFVTDRAKPALGGEVIAFGKPHQEIVNALISAGREAKAGIVSLSDLPIPDVARELAISTIEAQVATHREYTELFRLADDNAVVLGRLVNALRRRGIRCVPHGRHQLATATPDCAESLLTLRKLWRLTWGDHVMIGLGDSDDDVDWLQHVDIPIIVQSDRPNPSGRAVATRPTAPVTRWPGEHGWSEAILHSVGTLLTPPGDVHVPGPERQGRDSAAEGWTG
jgi:predicted mannosyl-3-phosphoglycerate phosphatase (HAD superfamily)